MRSPLRGGQDAPTECRREARLHLAEVPRYPLSTPQKTGSANALPAFCGAPLRVYVEPSAYTLFLSRKRIGTQLKLGCVPFLRNQYVITQNSFYLKQTIIDWPARYISITFHRKRNSHSLLVRMKNPYGCCLIKHDDKCY